MIYLTRLNRVPLVLNSDLIEHLDTTPDTVITLTNGQKLMVLEPASEVVRKVIEYRRAIYQQTLRCPMLPGQPGAMDPDGAGEAA